MTRIVILGGGFGGLYTALRLNQFTWSNRPPEIVLVEKHDRFLFSPLLYELITNEVQSWEIAPAYADILANTSIRFLQDEVTDIEAGEGKNQVTLKNNGTFNYDYLTVALGGKTPTSQVKGVDKYAIPFRTLEDAYRLKEKLRSLENSDKEYIRVVIAGGGCSGVELALKIAARLGKRGKIRIVERNDSLLRSLSPFNRKTASAALEKAKCWVDLETEVVEVKEGEVSLCYKNQIDTIPADIVVWTVGTKPAIPPGLANKLTLPTTLDGKIEINSYLQVFGMPHIWAIGDLAACQDEKGNRLPATAQVAIQQADYCAWNIWATIENKPLLPFKYQPLGEMLALGAESATMQALGVSLSGNLAYLARRLIYLYRLPTIEHQIAVAFSWMTTPLTNLLKSLEAV
ncbi:MAG: NAD(P)/FAD-dependent oxidoreductase [Geminocystis sp.]|nr:NAD(P)/FAD-dependent oxidoreductase [Geminocystis sp.]HIK37680.1 NAD(P)/FAD-dependent oxidoreductase [Geminocystis sp. M7585_C2015_104]MCS7148818.1 NAD(P)/FAD-dependent oxidoreductase [Geminocystis sp.]MCX8078452.1 NAD(P)/FAD-dependent oxidoreductase [Geminocystis sp.]MDW8115344.1 NAD(P)/FAD-dependent oxidoreductase [Geminocystis sp.]